ncbi:MAG TPA: hypothetical protein VKA68_11580, partial [bacterium]|nr:hypothetical protein [bacterium]
FDYSAFDEAVYHYFDALALHPFLIPGNNLWEYTNLTDEFVPAEGVESLMKKLVEKPTLFPLEILFQWKERARAAFAVRMPRNISFVISNREKQLFIDTVNSVKAAGVEFLFEPQTLFREQHDTIRDRLTSTHQATSPAQEVHEQEDSFTIGGLLGRTYFNQSVFN